MNKEKSKEWIKFNKFKIWKKKMIWTLKNEKLIFGKNWVNKRKNKLRKKWLLKEKKEILKCNKNLWIKKKIN